MGLLSARIGVPHKVILMCIPCYLKLAMTMTACDVVDNNSGHLLERKLELNPGKIQEIQEEQTDVRCLSL